MTNETLAPSVLSDPTSQAGRPPAPAAIAGGLTLLLSLFGGYGAIYFTGLEGWDAMGITYVTTYEAVSLFGVVSSVALLRGSEAGRLGVTAYGVFMVGFTVMKLVTVQEWEAIPFGVLGAVTLGLALHRRTRRFTRRG